jgi:hypothetical protein
MNKQTKRLGMMAVMLGALSGAPHAADTSTSIVARQTPKPVGVSPLVSYVHAIATAVGSFTYDVLDPKSNVPASKIAGCVTTFEKSDGTGEVLKATRSGRTMTISAGVSDTVAVSDTARTICVLKP